MADIVGKIKIDGSGVATGLNQATAAVNKFGSDVKRTIAGMFTGAAFVSAIRKTVQEIDQISDVSEELDMPVEQVQALRNAAMDASDSFEKLLAILTKIQDIQIDIVRGDSANGLKSRAILQKHGVGVEQVNNMSSMQFAQMLAKQITDKAEINQLLGPKMAGKFNNYRGTINNLEQNTAEGVASGRIMGKAEIDDINNTIAEGKKIWDGLWKSIFFVLSSVVITLRNILSGLADVMGMTNTVRKLSKWSADSGMNVGVGYALIKSIYNYFKTPTPKKTTTTSGSPSGPLLPPDQLGATGKGGIYSDSLLSIGNFLGQGTSGMTTVATLVEETKKQTVLMQEMVTIMKTPKSQKDRDFNENILPYMYMNGFGG